MSAALSLFGPLSDYGTATCRSFTLPRTGRESTVSGVSRRPSLRASASSPATLPIFGEALDHLLIAHHRAPRDGFELDAAL